jgi:hypothetical protein
MFWSTDNGAFMEAAGFSEKWHPLHFVVTPKYELLPWQRKKVRERARLHVRACVRSSSTLRSHRSQLSRRHVALLGTRMAESVSSQLIRRISSDEYSVSGSRGCPILHTSVTILSADYVTPGITRSMCQTRFGRKSVWITRSRLRQTSSNSNPIQAHLVTSHEGIQEQMYSSIISLNPVDLPHENVPVPKYSRQAGRKAGPD